MTQFSPAKIGLAEKNIIEDSLHISAKLVVDLLPEYPWALFILGRIFDGKIPFYYGLKTGYQMATGHPGVRMAVAKKFFGELGGCQKIVETLRSGDSFWCGSEVLQCILGIANGYEISHSIDDRTRQELAIVVMEKVVNLPDEVVKKENTDSLSLVIQSIGTLVSLLSLKDLFQDRFFIFWFDCIVRYINSSSIVVKLFGWEQMAEIIEEVKSERPFATKFTVEEAGTPFVNGEYLIDPRTIDNEVVQYVKEGNPQANVPLLTLFRCNMRNSKSKWWFISHADAEKPGTEKDIDYYVHRSTLEEEREPSSHNWTNSHPGMVLHGKLPCPILKRGDAVVGHDGLREDSIDLRLVRWCQDQDVLSQVFNASMHREIINRSIKLLQFLQEYNALPVSKLNEIWNASIKSREKDITDEIFSILVQMLATSTPEAFDAILNFASDTLQSEDGFVKVVCFLEKFSLEDFKNTSTIRSPTMIGKLLSLVWDVYCDKRFSTTPGSGFIQDLLSFCFKQKGGLDMVVQKVRDCKYSLDRIATECADRNASSDEEDHISQTLQTLFFLVSKAGHHNVDALETEAQSMIDTLVVEVTRFATNNRSQGDRHKYITELRLRFQILRRFYSVAICRDVDVIIQLWEAICHSVDETDEFASFLKGEGQYDSIFVKEDVLLLYDRIFCSNRIDWSCAGEKTFECFRSFFHLLESWPAYLIDQELPPRRGLSSLWSMCLSTQDGKIGHAAIELLLLAYESLLIANGTALVDFIQNIFDKLKEFSSEDSFDSARSSRCIDILQQALMKFGCGKAIAHAAKGTIGRVTIPIYYKRLNYSSHIDSLRFDKNSDGFLKIDMHPFHTVKMLKAKIIDAANLGSSTTITFDNSPRLLSDHARLFELGNLDGTEISVSYQVNYTHRLYDDDMYGSYYNGGKSDSSCFGQLVIDDLSKFDTLLSLCQQSRFPELIKKVWKLLMLLPSQTNMVELIRNMALQNDPDFASEYQGTESWDDILVDSSQVRSTYLLQILDYLLRPASEANDLHSTAKSFVQAFSRSGGLSTVITTLIQLIDDDDVVNYEAMITCLHIIYSLAFSRLSRIPESDDVEDDLSQPDIAEQSLNAIINLNENDASSLIDKLLLIARGAALREDSNIVHDALVVISLVIRSPASASQLMKKEYTRELLTSVLRNKSKKLREIAANFAIQIGKVQSAVFQWLFQELNGLSEDDEFCSEIFRAMVSLMSDAEVQISKEMMNQLTEFLVDRILAYPSKRPSFTVERYTLLGYLELLEQILLLSPLLVQKTKLGGTFLTTFVKEFLLVLPDETDSEGAVCDTAATRSVGFRVVSRFLEQFNDYDFLLNDLERLTRLASKQMHYHWGMQVSFDIKRPDIDFIGLKNQGCTCYMNSLLQVLYMCPRFREAILNTPIRECHRTTLWHLDDAQLVGKKVNFEWSNGEWRCGNIVGYDADTRNHRVQYERLDGTPDEIVLFNLHEGRIHRETGRVKLVMDYIESGEPITEREDAAFRVMEQLQRAFTFMKLSKKKYFDLRPFVDSCKSLNLSFNVYHQNDASEFCDQLLDRVETVAKGKHTKLDMWEDVFLKTVFGGKMLTQKIPQDCPAFDDDKDSCGLWQSPRLENYLKVEVQIRGKETVAESLQELVQGELMDGDNKIQCDVCKKKESCCDAHMYWCITKRVTLALEAI
jgi:ubiquitin carboxyl-terminal hydrolase 9/24